MEWLRKLSQSFLDTQFWGKQFHEQNPEHQPPDEPWINGQFEVYQSSDFPHVFLGGENDFEEVETKAGQPICEVVDCRDLPEINKSWDFATFTTVQTQFDSKVHDLIQKIISTNCPIFIHCAMGANRSVSVLAAALAQLTGKSLNNILSEMKQVRSCVYPSDPYYLMALQQSPSETPEFKQQRFNELDQDSNTAQSPFRRISSWLQKIAFPAMNARIPEISPQEAHQNAIGPFYHGTSPEVIDQILEQGFQWEEAEARSGGTSHGYEARMYHEDCPPPVHHLGYGIYLTEVKSIAKDFGYGSMKNVLEFWILKEARIATINFGAPRTMMKWWNQNGYDCELAKTDRVAATRMLTQTLSANYDAVLYKGKGMYRLLDGNQICIYNPSILRCVNKNLAQSGEVGSKVVRKLDGMKGVLQSRRPLSLEISKQYHNDEPEFLTVKWQRGGTDMNVYPSQVDFL